MLFTQVPFVQVPVGVPWELPFIRVPVEVSSERPFTQVPVEPPGVPGMCTPRAWELSLIHVPVGVSLEMPFCRPLNQLQVQAFPLQLGVAGPVGGVSCMGPCADRQPTSAAIGFDDRDLESVGGVPLQLPLVQVPVGVPLELPFIQVYGEMLLLQVPFPQVEVEVLSPCRTWLCRPARAC